MKKDHILMITFQICFILLIITFWFWYGEMTVLREDIKALGCDAIYKNFSKLISYITPFNYTWNGTINYTNVTLPSG